MRPSPLPRHRPASALPVPPRRERLGSLSCREPSPPAPRSILGLLGLAAALLALPACARRYSNDTVQVSQNLVAFDPPGNYPDIVWTSSLDEGRTRAADEHKPLIIFIRAAWSRSSMLMESTVWKDGRVLSEAPRFIAVRVDLTSAYGAPIPDFLKDYDVRNVPTTLIVSSEGKILGRFGEGKARSVTVAAAMRDAK